MTTEKYNILVVEDEQFHFDRIYKRAFANDVRLDVDHASTESEAKEKIRRKAYDVAFVDIMLREDSHDRGGVEVISFFQELKEPTAIIVVSATDDIKVALDVYKAGIFDFLQKDTMHTPREDVSAVLEKALENIKYRETGSFGRFSNIKAFLANPQMTPFWEDQWQRELGTNFTNFTSALNNSLSARFPILRIKGQRESLLRGDSSRTAYGYFWSKRIGQPIMMSLAFIDANLPHPRQDLSSTKVYERTFGNLQVAIFVIDSGIARSEFCESPWDEPV